MGYDAVLEKSKIDPAVINIMAAKIVLIPL
jgi:hypothetical protein